MLGNRGTLHDAHGISLQLSDLRLDGLELHQHPLALLRCLATRTHLFRPSPALLRGRHQTRELRKCCLLGRQVTQEHVLLRLGPVQTRHHQIHLLTTGRR